MTRRVKWGFRRAGAGAAVATILTATIFALIAPSGPALGQVVDPYATTTSTTQATTTTFNGLNCRIRIEISIGRGPSGIRIRVFARCFPPGARVFFTFNGRTMGSDISTPDGGTAAGLPGPLAALVPAKLLAAVRAQAATTETVADTSFDIPSVAPGTYPVCAFSDGVAPVCTTFEVISAGASNGTRSLASTGLALLPYVGAGLAAVAVGWTLRMSSRRHRRSA